MSVIIKPASVEEKQTIFSLLQFYLKELSQFPDEQIEYLDQDGVYHYPYLDAYWLDNERYPYILLTNNEIAGFALVRQESTHWEMAEFYILPEFRRRGLATTSVLDIFKKHAGMWQIEFNKHNQAGRALWLKIAKRSSKNDILFGYLKTGHDYISFSV
jgi:predicted acetyltransferase